MNCPNCGSPLPDTAKFCDKCGAGTAAATQPPVQAAPPVEAPVEAAADAPVEAPAEKPKAASTKRNVIILVAVLIIVLIGAALAVFAIGSGENSDASDLLNTAERYLSEANYEQAIIEFDKVIAIDPMNASAYIGKANAYISAGDIEKAIETLTDGYSKTGSDVIKAKLDELIAQQSASDGQVTVTQRPVGFAYGDARCLEIERMLIGYINGQGELDASLLAEVTELMLYSDCYISVICGNKGGTDLSGTGCYTVQGSVDNIDFAKHLVNASIIAIEGSSITDLSPLSGLTQLKKLSLFGSYSISDVAPLASLTALTHLDLGMGCITDISPLAALTGLVSLDLNGNRISDISAVSAMSELKYLDLGGNELTDISALSGLNKLVHLDLSINDIADISAVSGMTELTQLYLWDNSISQLSALSGLTKLERLYLEYNDITDVAPLAGLSQLSRLYVIGNDISDSSLDALEQALPECTIM